MSNLPEASLHQQIPDLSHIKPPTVPAFIVMIKNLKEHGKTVK